MLDMNSHSVGKSVRLSRLFREDGRSLMLAIDHAKNRGMVKGLEDTRSVLDWALPAGTDAVLMNPGAFRRYASLWKHRSSPGVILALDFHMSGTFPGESGGQQAYRLLSTVNEVAALGADAVKIVLVFGRRDLEVHADNLAIVGAVVRESEELGIPVMIEPVLWGNAVTPEQANDPQIIANICRVAVEVGADIVKAPYVEGVYSDLCKVLPVPITLLGGAKGNLEDIYRFVERSVQEGVRGLTFGRNVWQHDDPPGVWRKLNSIIHGERDGRFASG